jgi:hypothetical protein
MAIVRGGTVRPHVQAFADAVARSTGAASFGTYNGHSPSIDRALDIFVPVSSAALGNAVCDFALANLERFGIDYVIYRQQIYNPEIARYWRWMADRGSPTANHYDHVHVSFATKAPPGPDPKPPAPPTPTPTDEPKEVPTLFVFDGPEGGIYVTDGFRKRGVPNRAYLDAFFFGMGGRVPHLGTLPHDAFVALPDFEGNQTEALAGPLYDLSDQEPLGCAAEDE